MTPAFEAIFRASPYPYLVIGRDLTILAANDAYLASVKRSEQDLIGKHVFEAFPLNPKNPDSTNQKEIRRSIDVAIATRKPHTAPFLRYAVPVNTPEGNGFEDRLWSVNHTPCIDESGEIISVIQNAIDVTDLYKYDDKTRSASITPEPTTPDSAFSRAQMHEAMNRIVNDERGHLRNLFNQAPGFVAVVTGPELVFEMANEGYYQLVGHRDIIGKPVWEALPELAQQGYEELLHRVFETGEPVQSHAMKLQVQRKPGSPLEERYIDLTYQPYHAEDGSIIGILALGYDVTDSVLAQASQRAIEERLREGMSAARMVVWDWEIKSRKMEFSENVLEVLGRTADNIDALYDAIDPNDRKRMRKIHAQAIAEKSGYRETLRFTRGDNGRLIWVDVRGKVRCDENGEPISVRGVTIDVTDRVLAERELIKADRRKNEFLAMLAHELRNPLAPISSAAELLKLGQLDARGLKMASDIIQRQIRHMTGLVDDLIDVSRVTRGLITTDQRPLEIKQIIADALEQTGPTIREKQHELTVRLPDEDARVLGDHKRLVQVLSNLLNNAAKYTPPGGRIQLDLHIAPDDVAIRVKDNGIGISDDLLPRVFDLFTQAERASDRSQGGLGVGLALVKRLVELHGGKVSAESQGNGQGSTFVIHLPPLHEQGQTDQTMTPGAPTKTIHPLTIMIVDDNADAANMLGMYLETAGHHVISAYSAGSALDRVRREVPDVFLLDIGLPEMDGFQLARRLRSFPTTSDSVLIAITGYGQEQDRVNSEAAGFNHHLVKPVKTDELLALLATIEPFNLRRERGV